MVRNFRTFTVQFEILDHFFFFSYPGTSCTEQMIRMLECFKGNEFNEAHCAKEVKAFNECVAEARVSTCINP